jgi:hypothetical protein
MFENCADTTHTITVPVVEVDFVDDIIKKKKKNYLKILLLMPLILLPLLSCC